jgi:LmbE family N-acetylglucosaminyl deacetylase
MERRGFVAQILAGSALFSPGVAGAAQHSAAPPQRPVAERPPEVVVERPVSGKPHAGKVLAAIQPHADDISYFAAGTVAKLIAEGYSGYLIKTTNDDKCGAGSLGEIILHNEQDTDALAKVLSLQKAFTLGYRNHEMDGNSRLEMRERLIFLIRMLKIDTVIGYDPWGLYEENPDHYVTAQMVEAACWMAGMDKDYPEHLEAGLRPHSVQEKYYFARGPQLVNRVVDISPWVDVKVAANLANKTQGGGVGSGAHLRAQLAARKLRLPLLGNDDETANREYVKHFFLDYDSHYLRGVPSDRETGRPYGLEWAEAFHYIGPPQSLMDRYISEHALPL